LSIPEYVQLLLDNDAADTDVISCFADGNRFKQHSLFGDPSKFSLSIQLFYDEIGTTNPLRENSAMCNVGVFFFTVQNLANKYNSCFANVHLLSLAYSHNIKVYGFDRVLEKFVAEMNMLQLVGFSGEFPIINEKNCICRPWKCVM